MRIAGLFLLLAQFAPAGPKLAVGEIFDRVSTAYDKLENYQFELYEHMGKIQRTIKFAAILPSKFYLQTLPKDLRCVTDGETTWSYLAKRAVWDGGTVIRPANDEDEKESCQSDFSAAGNAFIDRWKKIGEWTPFAKLSQADTLKIDGAGIQCWVIEIRPRSGGVTRLWIDQTRYLVLRETFQNRDAKVSVLRQWRKASVEDPPDAVLFTPAGLGKTVRYVYGTVGMEAPDFQFTDPADHSTNLQSPHGKVTVLYFWPLPTARPAREDFYPAMQNLYRDSAYEDVQFIAVIPAKRESLRQYGVKMPIAADPDKKIHAAYQTEEKANVVLIDKDGKVVRDFQGMLKLSDIRAAIDDLIL